MGIMKPLVSVITVSYNAVSVIERTILSVISQNYSNIEYILIDGGSVDGTVDVIRSYQDQISYWISESDEGIYDAMNKGILRSRGKWINFMNAGDTFSDISVLDKIFSQKINENVGIIYGNTALFKNGVFVEPFENKPFWLSFMPFRGKGICHQSMFVKSDLAKRMMFDTSYRICSDYDMCYKIYQRGYDFLFADIVISHYDVTGISCNNPILVLEENGRILKCRNNILYMLFYLYCWLKNKRQ